MCVRAWRAGARLGIVTRAHFVCVAPTHPNEAREAEVLLVVPLDCLLYASSTGRA